MGTVYLAEQREPIHRQVALKIVKHGLDSKEVIARFESERQALAMMDHPNIARVLDAGATENGVPYFAMEYVRGTPITEYCDRHRLSMRQRLALFCDVCHAIHHAHQRGVIHRDIKPSNVLVALVDGKPVPKVIDFGVAKAIHQRLTERTLFTHMGVLVGTPAYMSPEQTGVTEMEVDTTTDIYSLGVMLYELLVGAVPFDPREMRRLGFMEIVRIIREVEPLTPSHHLRSLGERASEVAKLRATNLEMLQRQLRGDLEFITMKALEKDRARRYPSASEFAADVVRHLRDEPVLASPPDPVYRLRKFTRRHKGPIAAAVAVALAMLIGLVISSFLYLRSERQRTVALHLNYVASIAAADLALRLADVPTAQNRLLRTDPAMRGFEWGLLWRRSDPSLATLYTDRLFAHAREGLQPGFAFTHAPERVYWGMGDTVHVWNAATYAPIQVYGGFGAVLAIARDGADVLAFKLGSLSLIAPASGAVRTNPKFAQADKLTGAELSPSGGQVATGTFDGRFRVWDVSSARNVIDIEFVDNPPDSRFNAVAFIAFQADSRRVAAVTAGGGLGVWDVGTARSLLRTDLAERSWHPIAMSADGGRVAVGSGSGVRVLDVNSGKTVVTLPGHVGGAGTVVFSPDGSLIASSARYGDVAVRLWSASTGDQIANFRGTPVEGTIVSLAFSPDGKRLFAGDRNGEARVWDVPTLAGELIRQTPHPYSSIALSPDGSRIAMKHPGTVEIWDALSGEQVLSWKTASEQYCYGDLCYLSHDLTYDSVAYSPDGSRIAAAMRDGSISIWDARSGAAIQTLREHETAVTALSFDPDGAHLASGAWDGTAIVWDLRNGKPVNRMKLAANVVSLAFNSAGDRLLIACGNVAHPASSDSMVTLWQPVGGQTPVRQFRLPANVNGTWAAAMSRDGRTVAATSPAGVFVWDALNGKLTGSAYASQSSAPTAIAFSPDGSRLVSGTITGGLRVFDRSADELLSLPGHGSSVRNVVFSPDGECVYSCGEDRDLRIWGTRSAYVPGAAELVNSLRARFFRGSDVSAQIKADRDMDPKLRQAALELASRRGNDMAKWDHDTRAILEDPRRAAADYRGALQSAVTALQAYPWSPALLTTLGIAQYRNGQYREALETLERSESLRGTSDSTDLILTSMTRYRLGETEKARKELQAAVPDRSHRADLQPPFVEEANTLIAPGGRGQ
jgi:WD40 repeat protein/serine/threonine protein kinase